MNRASSNYQSLMRTRTRIGKHLNVRIHVHSFATVLQRTRDNIGIALVPRRAFKKAIRRQQPHSWATFELFEPHIRSIGMDILGAVPLNLKSIRNRCQSNGAGMNIEGKAVASRSCGFVRDLGIVCAAVLPAVTSRAITGVAKKKNGRRLHLEPRLFRQSAGFRQQIWMRAGECSEPRFILNGKRSDSDGHCALASTIRSTGTRRGTARRTTALRERTTPSGERRVTRSA